MHIGNRKSSVRFMGVTTATLAAAAVTVGMANNAMAIPLFNGGNNLIGAAAGLDENMGGTHFLAPAGPLTAVPAGAYTAPSGATNAAGGQAVGMTESIRFTDNNGNGTYEAGIDTPTGLNLPQPQTLGAGAAGFDDRLGLTNPLLGLNVVPARAGALLRWDTNNQDPSMGADPKFLMPAGSVSGQVYNLNPQAVAASSAPTVDDGLSPGAAAGDSIPDFIPFVFDLNGARAVTYTLTFVGEDDTILDWDGDGISPSLGTGFDPDDVVPDALIPRKRDYEGGLNANIASPPLNEQYFNNNAGNDLTGAAVPPVGPLGTPTGTTGGVDPIDNFVDGTLILGGRLVNSFATLTWTEIDADDNTFGFQPSGLFERDIQFFADVIYDEGLLVTNMRVGAGSGGDVNFEWDDIPFNSFAESGVTGTGGFDVNGELDYDFTFSSSASQTFEVLSLVPEPLTSSMAIMGLAGLCSSMRRRRA